MSAFKWCRLWCDHSREMTVEDDSDWDSVGSYVYCTDCGCPLVQSYGYWDPKPGREEECDCPDCKRDFWKPRPPALPLQMPWRHEGERLRMWKRNADSWLEDFRTTWGVTHQPNSPADFACGRALWDCGLADGHLDDLGVAAMADLDCLADERDALLAAAKEALAFLSGPFCHSWEAPIVQALQAAIAKVEGKP